MLEANFSKASRCQMHRSQACPEDAESIRMIRPGGIRRQGARGECKAVALRALEVVVYMSVRARTSWFNPVQLDAQCNLVAVLFGATRNHTHTVEAPSGQTEDLVYKF